ncbi:hypothetical protein [Streptomyces sp. NPDC055085]
MHYNELTEGLILIDETVDDIGRVVEIKDNHVTLTSLHPNRREWEARSDDLRLATPKERMLAKVAAANLTSKNPSR